MLFSHRFKCFKLLSTIICTLALLMGISSPIISLAVDDVPVETTESSQNYIKSYNWPVAPEISANAAVLINVNTGTILYDKNCDEKKYPASMTKVLTALLAIEHNNLSDVITYSDEAVFDLEEGASYLALNYDEQLTVEQSLYGLMLASANDVANGLAIYTSGSIDAFADLMNERAAQIGCTNTHFANANGLHDENHYTTCHDMALIMMEAIKNTTFLTIDSTEYYEVPPTNMQPLSRPLRMLHKMMNPTDAYYYKYCVAGKTGYTDQAGSTLVTYCKKDDMELVSVIMDSVGTQYDDTIALMNYGFDNFMLYDMSEQDISTINANQSSSLLFSLLPSTSSLIEVNSNSSIILPIYENMSSVDSIISYNENNEQNNNSIASITYYFEGTRIGSADLRFKSGINFSKPTVNILKDDTDEIFTIEDKEVITYKQLWTAIALIAVGLILLIGIIIYFLPHNIRRRRLEQVRRTRQRFKYYD